MPSWPSDDRDGHRSRYPGLYANTVETPTATTGSGLPSRSVSKEMATEGPAGIFVDDAHRPMPMVTQRSIPWPKPVKNMLATPSRVFLGTAQGVVGNTMNTVTSSAQAASPTRRRGTSRTRSAAQQGISPSSSASNTSLRQRNLSDSSIISLEQNSLDSPTGPGDQYDHDGHQHHHHDEHDLHDTDQSMVWHCQFCSHGNSDFDRAVCALCGHDNSTQKGTNHQNIFRVTDQHAPPSRSNSRSITPAGTALQVLRSADQDMEHDPPPLIQLDSLPSSSVSTCSSERIVLYQANNAVGSFDGVVPWTDAVAASSLSSNNNSTLTARSVPPQPETSGGTGAGGNVRDAMSWMYALEAAMTRAPPNPAATPSPGGNMIVTPASSSACSVASSELEPFENEGNAVRSAPQQVSSNLPLIVAQPRQVSTVVVTVSPCVELKQTEIGEATHAKNDQVHEKEENEEELGLSQKEFRSTLSRSDHSATHSANTAVQSNVKHGRFLSDGDCQSRNSLYSFRRGGRRTESQEQSPNGRWMTIHSKLETDPPATVVVPVVVPLRDPENSLSAVPESGGKGVESPLQPVPMERSNHLTNGSSRSFLSRMVRLSDEDGHQSPEQRLSTAPQPLATNDLMQSRRSIGRSLSRRQDQSPLKDMIGIGVGLTQSASLFDGVTDLESHTPGDNAMASAVASTHVVNTASKHENKERTAVTEQGSFQGDDGKRQYMLSCLCLIILLLGLATACVFLILWILQKDGHSSMTNSIPSTTTLPEFPSFAPSKELINADSQPQTVPPLTLMNGTMEHGGAGWNGSWAPLGSLSESVFSSMNVTFTPLSSINYDGSLVVMVVRDKSRALDTAIVWAFDENGTRRSLGQPWPTSTNRSTSISSISLASASTLGVEPNETIMVAVGFNDGTIDVICFDSINNSWQQRGSQISISNSSSSSNSTLTLAAQITGEGNMIAVSETRTDGSQYSYRMLQWDANNSDWNQFGEPLTRTAYNFTPHDISADGQFAAFSSCTQSDGRQCAVEVISWNNSRLQWVPRGGPISVKSSNKFVRLSANGEYLVCADEQGVNVLLYNQSTNNYLMLKDFDLLSNITSFTMSPASGRLAAVDTQQTVSVWDSVYPAGNNTGQNFSLKGENSSSPELPKLAISGDGITLIVWFPWVSGTHNTEVILFRRRNARRVRR